MSEPLHIRPYNNIVYLSAAGEPIDEPMNDSRPAAARRTRAVRSVIDPEYRDAVERYRVAKNWEIVDLAFHVNVDEATLRRFRRTAKIGLVTKAAVDLCMETYPA